MTSRDRGAGGDADGEQSVYRPVLVPDEHCEAVERLVHDLECDAAGDDDAEEGGSE